MAEGGLIPARAGKTAIWRAIPASLKAHPRAGGENTWRLLTAQLSAGSSPRGRGKLPKPSNVLGRIRLIPARAGKTTRRS